MDSQDHLKLAGLKSFLNDEMADASRSEGKSISSGDLGEFVKKPNGDWEVGQLLHPYLFASESGNSVKDLVADTLYPDRDKGYSFDISGSNVSFQSKKPKTTVKNMLERSTCVHQMLNFARANGAVKHLSSALDFERHSDYEMRLIEYAQQFKFEFIIEFDVLFRKGVHTGLNSRHGLSGWHDLAQELYHRVFVAQSYTRIGESAPGAPVQRLKEERGRDGGKPGPGKKGNKVTLHDKNKAGEGLFLNWNRGKCGEHGTAAAVTKEGKKCTFKHACKYCLDTGHRLSECSAYTTALKSG